MSPNRFPWFLCRICFHIGMTCISMVFYILLLLGCTSCPRKKDSPAAYRTNETTPNGEISQDYSHYGLVRSFNDSSLQNPWGGHIEFLEDESKIIFVQTNRLAIWDWKEEEVIKERPLDFLARKHTISDDRKTYFLSSHSEPFKVTAYSTEDLLERASLETKAEVVSMDFNKEEQKLLVVTTTGADIWYINEGKTVRVLEKKYLSIGRWANNKQIYLNRGSDIVLFSLNKNRIAAVYSLALHPTDFVVEEDKKRIVFCGPTDTRDELPQHMDIWSLRSKKNIRIVDTLGFSIQTLYKIDANRFLGLSKGNYGRIFLYSEEFELENSIFEWFYQSALSPSKRYLAVSNVGIKVFELPNLKMVTNKNRIYGHVEELKFLKGADLLAGSDEKMTMVWDVKTGRLVKRYDSGGINCLLSNDTILSYDKSNKIFVVEDDAGNRIKEINTPSLYNYHWHLNCRNNFVLGSVVGKRGRADNKAILRYLDEEEEGNIIETKVLSTDDNPVFNQVYISDPKGEWIMVLDRNGVVLGKWDTRELEKVEKLQRLEGRSYGARGLSVSRNGQIVLVYGREKLYVVDAESLEVLHNLRINKDIAIAALDNRGTLIALSERYSRELIVWNTKEMKVVNRFNYEKASVTALEFCPNGKYLAAGYGNSEVILWDLAAKADPNTKTEKSHDGAVEKKEQLLITIDSKEETD